jgi:hypothetical protein
MNAAKRSLFGCVLASIASTSVLGQNVSGIAKRTQPSRVMAQAYRISEDRWQPEARRLRLRSKQSGSLRVYLGCV